LPPEAPKTVTSPEKKKPDQSARGWPKDPGNSEWAQRKITENSRSDCTPPEPKF